mmetsp:Transcript_64181/g.188341  ORF Transcript_64181/g.188341 Transcript_64181/m.188341 type:complete len:443 (-) Transcript_64181:902-2230(-)
MRADRREVRGAQQALVARGLGEAQEGAADQGRLLLRVALDLQDVDLQPRVLAVLGLAGGADQDRAPVPAAHQVHAQDLLVAVELPPDHHLRLAAPAGARAGVLRPGLQRVDVLEAGELPQRRPEVLVLLGVVETQVEPLPRAREVPLEAALGRGGGLVVLPRHLGAHRGRHRDALVARLLREAQVEGVDEQLLLQRQDAGALALVADVADAPHEVHLREDRPELAGVLVRRDAHRVRVLQELPVPEEDVGRGAHGAGVEELVQEALLVEAVSRAVWPEEAAEDKVRRPHPVRPAVGEVRGPLLLVVQVEPREAPALLPQEVVHVVPVPGAVAEVHDVPRVGASRLLAAKVRRQLVELLPVLVAVGKAWRELPEEGHRRGLQLGVLLLVQLRPPLAEVLEPLEVRRDAADLDHHHKTVAGSLGQVLVSGDRLVAALQRVPVER